MYVYPYRLHSVWHLTSLFTVISRLQQIQLVANEIQTISKDLAPVYEASSLPGLVCELQRKIRPKRVRSPHLLHHSDPRGPLLPLLVCTIDSALVCERCVGWRVWGMTSEYGAPLRGSVIRPGKTSFAIDITGEARRRRTFTSRRIKPPRIMSMFDEAMKTRGLKSALRHLSPRTGCWKRASRHDSAIHSRDDV